MNAPADQPTRAEQQALSAPFLIEDQDVVRMIARVADERGTEMHEVARLAIEDYAKRHDMAQRGPEWLERYWREHPMPLPTGLVADKRFYDSLNDEL